jgi:hypothetical protein
MIIPYIHKRSYRIVSDCREKVAEVNANLMEATFDVFETNQNYWLNIPVYLNDATDSYWRLISSFGDLEEAGKI